MIRMIADFKGMKTGQVVNPDPETTAWLLSRKYAVPAPDETIEQAAKPLPAVKKTKERTT